MRARGAAFSMRVVGVAGGIALLLLLLPSTASAAGTSTVESISTFGVTTTQCAGPTVPLEVGISESLSGQIGNNNPVPSDCTPLPSELSSIQYASVTTPSSASGTATVSARSLGDTVVGEEAYGVVELDASIPLSSPASSVEVTIPYTTSGLSWSTVPANQACGATFPVPCDEAQAVVSFGPPLPKCADGTYGFGIPTPAGINRLTGPSSGTVGIHYYCPDGSDLVSAQLAVEVYAEADSDSGHAENASANVQMTGVTATINP
ncbi:MAG TPA: hypothetical protein VMP41_02145 [Acidimicrobiales bacterium]|nr:hypothetical protein [Acidimicrobiales bacterium]